MRLKTKLILICCTSILASSMFCNVSIYHSLKRSSLEAAEGQSFEKASAVFYNLQKKMDLVKDVGAEVNKNVLQYLVKQQNDDLLVCFSENGQRGEAAEIFNATVFGKSDFEALDYEEVWESSLDVAQMDWEGKHFLVYRQSEYGRWTTYKLEDISYVWERMGMLGVRLAALIFVVAAAVCLVLLAVLNMVLRPLQELNEGAKQIAEGRYGERIALGRRDEIGELSENFNLMAEAVEHRTRRMEETERKKTLFMGNLTHELKTPMTAISGYAKTLLTAKISEEDREEALSYIYEESCRLERLSRKMMNLLLLEENEQIHLEKVSASVLFHHAKEACGSSLAEDGIILECRENGEAFSVDVDLFTEVLINLIDNGRKASRRGDRIILSATRGAIEVVDFGKGIPEGEREKILEPFYMIDKSRSRKSGGAGLGLAIAALILERHHCKIEIESKVGQGTRMILHFV